MSLITFLATAFPGSANCEVQNPYRADLLNVSDWSEYFEKKASEGNRNLFCLYDISLNMSSC